MYSGRTSEQSTVGRLSLHSLDVITELLDLALAATLLQGLPQLEPRHTVDYHLVLLEYISVPKSSSFVVDS